MIILVKIAIPVIIHFYRVHFIPILTLYYHCILSFLHNVAILISRFRENYIIVIMGNGESTSRRICMQRSDEGTIQVTGTAAIVVVFF